VGPSSCLEVATSYGFKNPISTQQVFEYDPRIWPFRSASNSKYPAFKSNFKIAALLLMHDPTDWGRDLQIMTDLLRSNGGMVGTMEKNLNRQRYTRKQTYQFTSILL
jgi:hypothetical protein